MRSLLNWLPASLVFVFQAVLAKGDLIDNGKVVTLGDITYYAGGVPVSTLQGINSQIPDPDSCSEGLYIYPWPAGTTDYRNCYFLVMNHPLLGISDWAVAGYAGAEEVIVPLGEAPYNSTVTGKVEYLPVTIAIQAARGCDFVLARLMEELEKVGILKPVSTRLRLYSS
ncbi:hypothetical protein BDZ45DRAFT_740133 [Acephala macrosclerotiorum]|nr:hypothetical protein BDZ45DRAFT_740133 [Acephala macrosclerotiorum]